MVFIRKNLQAKRRNMTFIKGATLFFLGMSAVLFMAQAFDIGVMVPNTIQYIQKVFLTADGGNTSITGITLDGSNGNGTFIGTLSASVVSGTTVTGTTINGSTINGNIINGNIISGTTVTGTTINGTNINASLVRATGISGTVVTGATICLGTDCRVVWPSGGGAGANYYTTGMSFDSGTNILTLYVSGTNAVTGYINFSGATNWNNAAIWMNNSGSILWNSGNILWNRYLGTGQNITTIATLSCPSTQIPKSNGAGWICSTDQVGGVGGTDYYTTGINFNSGTNMLTLYVTGFGPITQTITMSGATARYTASAWVNNTGSTITNRYITTGIHMNALAKATLNCAAGDIVKYNGTIWECSGDLQGVAGGVNYYTTGLSFDNTTNKLSLYVSGANTVSGYINLSGASNWNSAYTWMTSGTGNILSNRYNNIGININTLATATLSCSVGQIAKYNGTNWICGADLTGGSSLWLQGTPTNNIYYNLGNVGIGINNPGSTLSIGGIAGGSLYVDGTANFAIGETNSSFLISDAVNGTNAMQVDNDTQKAVLFDSHNAGYKVGIGTDTPTTKLSVVDGGTINVAPGVKNSYVNVTAPDTLGTTPPKGIDIGYVNSGILEGGYLWSKSGLGLLFSTDQADTHISRLDMTINPSGNVGIGAMSAGAKLHVAGDGKFTTSVQVGVSGAPRCTSQADAGKIVYGIVCVGTTYTPEFIGCTQNGSAASVTQKVIMTGASWVGAACPGGIIVGDTAI